MWPDVFISYSSKDKNVADAICGSLEQKGVQCWIAPRNVKAGHKYGAEIISALKACKILVLIVSANSIESEHVQIEIERATGYNKFIIPYYIEHVALNENLEYFLSSKQWINAFQGDSSVHVEVLYESVKRLLGQDIQESAETQEDAETEFISVSTDAGAWIYEADETDENDETEMMQEVEPGEARTVCLKLIGNVSLPPLIQMSPSFNRPFTIGRFDISKGIAQNDFEFPKETKNVSRRHAIIERTIDGYTIKDSGSKAGTFINGMKITSGVPYQLTPQTKISFGNYGADYVFEIIS